MLARQAIRAIHTSRIVRKDLIQDLYLKELKAYKPAAVTDVAKPRTFSPPTAPEKPQTLDKDALAKELAAYDSDAPKFADSPAKASAAADESEGAGADEYLKLVEADLPAEEKHH